jgi:hypothetical protein
MRKYLMTRPCRYCRECAVSLGMRVVREFDVLEGDS